jgi:hypothetical protein
MKKYLLLMGYVVIAFILMGAKNNCSSESESDMKQRIETERILNDIHDKVGMPKLVNYQQKRLMKMIIEKCDKANLITYTYLQSSYTGRPVFLFESVGYGVPFAAQYTSPEKRTYYSGGSYKMPQGEPNGLSMPTSSDATWVLVPNKKGGVRLAYIEFKIMVSPFKLPE